MPSGLYDKLKWVAMVGLYALSVLVSGLGKIWGWPYTTEIVDTIAVVGTALGIVLGISSASYYKKLAKTEVVEDIIEK